MSRFFFLFIPSFPPFSCKETPAYDTSCYKDDKKYQCGSYGKLHIIHIVEVVGHIVLEHVNAFMRIISPDKYRFTKALKSIQQRNQSRKQDHRPQKRQPYIIQTFPPSRPVHSGHFQIFLRDHGKAGQEQDHSVSCIFP